MRFHVSPRRVSSIVCPYCRDTITDRVLHACSGCTTSMHLACRSAHGKCTTLGCEGSVRPRTTPITIPAFTPTPASGEADLSLLRFSSYGWLEAVCRLSPLRRVVELNKKVLLWGGPVFAGFGVLFGCMEGGTGDLRYGIEFGVVFTLIMLGLVLGYTTLQALVGIQRPSQEPNGCALTLTVPMIVLGIEIISLGMGGRTVEGLGLVAFFGLPLLALLACGRWFGFHLEHRA